MKPEIKRKVIKILKRLGKNILNKARKIIKEL
jgi:hypothetical protein